MKGHQAELENDWVTEALAGVEPILTTEDALRVLRITRRQLYRLTGTGRIRALRRVNAGSSRLVIPRTEIERYLRSLEAA